MAVPGFPGGGGRGRGTPTPMGTNLLLKPANEVWGKVMFSEASVILSTAGGVCIGGGGWSASWGGAMNGGGGQTPSPSDTIGIRSTSRRYASYWNAFLFGIFLSRKPLENEKKVGRGNISGTTRFPFS